MIQRALESNVLWPLADHLGTLRDIAVYNEGTSTTSVTNHRTYDAFGKLVSEANAAANLGGGFGSIFPSALGKYSFTENSISITLDSDINRPDGLANWIGDGMAGNGNQVTLWDNYLLNISDAYGGKDVKRSPQIRETTDLDPRDLR